MDFANNYSALDRLVHNIAFSSRGAQIGLSALEDKVYARQLDAINPHKPVFVTALPRAGTTLLLEMLERSGQFGVHLYRDMPLLLTPIFWSKVSASFRREDTPRERAHGDGMMVSVESPEAFEETIWVEFWKEQYQARSVKPWHPKFKHAEFERFFNNHIKKILLLRQTNGVTPMRYLSKNNMNIGRIEYICKAFPEAQIVVPFRGPLQHAASLLKQHLGFLKLHHDDAFAKRYMREIGHYDFGQNLKPINFNGWVDNYSTLSPDTLEFWLRYWFEAYRYILDHKQANVALFCFDSFSRKPDSSLRALATNLQLPDIESFVALSGRVAEPKTHNIDTSALPDELMNATQALFERLNAGAINLVSQSGANSFSEQ
ncbi:MAG: sulfotransferase [Ketobacter sp.]